MAPSPDDRESLEKLQLSGATIHEFRTLLTIARGHVQLLQRSLNRTPGFDNPGAMDRLALLDDIVVRLVDELDGQRQGPDPDSDTG